jgi:hypothetical protein
MGFFDSTELAEMRLPLNVRRRFVRKIYGSAELIRGIERYCLWIESDQRAEVEIFPPSQIALKQCGR